MTDKTDTTFGGLVYDFNFDEIAKGLAERINRYTVKHNEVLGRVVMDESYAAALIKEYLLCELFPRMDTEIRCQQTKEMIQCLPEKQ